ncbi:ribonucleoside-diphosphate reductase large subunit [Acrasis kona]|uniref:Ribonucleoside-diphosphate reductase large subunit n=1 Tax=Acrasis kona TaxID=1008807 RepID=A0AAW2YZF2_9EUKA
MPTVSQDTVGASSASTRIPVKKRKRITNSVKAPIIKRIIFEPEEEEESSSEEVDSGEESGVEEIVKNKRVPRRAKEAALNVIQGQAKSEIGSTDVSKPLKPKVSPKTPPKTVQTNFQPIQVAAKTKIQRKQDEKILNGRRCVSVPPLQWTPVEVVIWLEDTKPELLKIENFRDFRRYIQNNSFGGYQIDRLATLKATKHEEYINELRILQLTDGLKLYLCEVVDLWNKSKTAKVI